MPLAITRREVLSLSARECPLGIFPRSSPPALSSVPMLMWIRGLFLLRWIQGLLLAPWWIGVCALFTPWIIWLMWALIPEAARWWAKLPWSSGPQSDQQNADDSRKERTNRIIIMLCAMMSFL